MDSRGAALLSDFVLDASAAMVLVMDDEPESPVMPIIQALTAGDAIVPSLWRYEMAGALTIAQRTGRIDRSELVRCLHAVTTMGCRVDDALASAADLIATAAEHAVTPYDAAYLALAMRRGMPLATTDRQLRTAADNAGVPLVW